MTVIDEKLSERDEIELLLPWYVTGRLEPADRARVDIWLARDTALARQLALIREEQDENRRSAEMMRVPASISVEQTFATVTKASPAPLTLRGFVASLKALFDGSFGGPLRFAAAAAGLVLLVQAATIGYLLTGRPDSVYQPASGTSNAAQAGTFVLIRFADAATAKDIAATLADQNVSIVDGPRSGGLYRVRIGPLGMTDAARDQRISELRSKPELFNFVTATP